MVAGWENGNSLASVYVQVYTGAMETKVFKSGNSLAVRLPKGMDLPCGPMTETTTVHSLPADVQHRIGHTNTMRFLFGESHGRRHIRKKRP